MIPRGLRARSISNISARLSSVAPICSRKLYGNSLHSTGTQNRQSGIILGCVRENPLFDNLVDIWGPSGQTQCSLGHVAPIPAARRTDVSV